ncbi:MAG TPA: YkgJ family cysteine cluster protein [Cyclobacteriaceae bacterium]|mgnify:CR=1 FL=1|nr:YkgJ family cysteine cluster protein [Cyclobacteriaceae bacterium]
MSLYRKVKSVERLFSELQQEISAFQSASELHCKTGCGKCCFKPDIEATILEFIPHAYFVYKQGKAFEWLNKLKEDSSPVCTLLNPFLIGKGQCSTYNYRGLICRLFGYSGRRNKYGKIELVTCDIIKTEQADTYNKTKQGIENGLMQLPIMHHYYSRLTTIDPALSDKFYPVNQAIRKAIEVVLHYYAYRPGRLPKSA